MVMLYCLSELHIYPNFHFLINSFKLLSSDFQKYPIKNVMEFSALVLQVLVQFVATIHKPKCFNE